MGACYGFEWGQLFYVQLSWKPTPPQDCIEPGPFTMRFQARGELGGEVVNFGLHGASPMNVTLGNQWQTFEIPRNSDSIDPRFGVEFYVEPLVKEDSQQSRIYLDDLQWLSQKPPAPGRCKPPRELPRTCEALDDVDGSAGGGSSSTAPKSWGGPATGACDSGNLGAGGAATLGPDILLIDDFEDGDEWSLPLPDGRAHWAIFNDGTATGYQYPEPCPKPTLMPADHEGSDWSLLTYGCGFDRQGAGMRLTLRTASDCEEPFDASIYDGIQFLAKGWASGEMLLRINTVATTPVRHGGSCVEPEGFPIGCFNAFQTSFYLSRTDEWELIQIPFALLEQGYPPHAWWEWSSNTTSIMSVSWAVSPGDYSPAFPVGTSSFDYAIDDVALYRK